MKKGLLFALCLTSSLSFAQSIIYTEDFQSGLVNFTLLNNDGLIPASSVSEFSDAWIRLADPDDPLNFVIGSTSFFDPAGQADRWIITPPITLGPYGNIAYWNARSHDPSFPDTYFVLVSSTDTQAASFTDTLYSIGGENPDWTARSGNLSELGLDNQTIHLAFVNRTDDGFKLYIDDIVVEKEDPSAVNELESIALSIYPNPTSDVLHLTTKQDVTLVKIFSLSGQELMQTQSNQVNVAELTPGTYFVQVSGIFGVATRRFVKR